MKFIIAALVAIFASATVAQEIIQIKSPYPANHSGHAAVHRMIQKVNELQNKFTLVLELKPGGQGVIALKSMDQTPLNAISIIHAPFVENSLSGKIEESDYVPISSLGSACWFLISKVGNEAEGLASLTKHPGDVVIGAPGIGSATHLTVLAIAEKINRPIRYVSFKSAAEANLLIAGDHDVNFGIAALNEMQNLQRVNSNIKPLAAHCSHRHAKLPTVRTTAEQGIDAPFVFNTFVASKNMPAERRQQLATLLDRAMRELGEDTIMQLSDFSPPMFRNQSAQQFHSAQVATLKRMLAKHKNDIAMAK
jgi:tripartite-type tricarboxylate transporter receptor subunit TctC